MEPDTIEFPAYLNTLASAGAAGLLIDATCDVGQITRLCEQLGAVVSVINGRVRLEYSDDALIPAWIEREVDQKAWTNTSVAGFLRHPSTNLEAMARAMAGAPQGTVVLAEHQHTGRGRFGRRWFSVPRSSVCFSLILRPCQPRNQWQLLTLAAGISLVRAIRQLEHSRVASGALPVELKWPNDVLVFGKKAAGILLEVFHEQAGNGGVVLGVGVNVGEAAVPAELRESATALNTETGHIVPRRRLLVTFINQFQDAYLVFEKGAVSTITDAWKSMSTMWNEVPVWIEEKGTQRPAVTCGISESGALLVRTSDGIRETIVAGDIRIRTQEE